jgi:hypothetical protein
VQQQQQQQQQQKKGILFHFAELARTEGKKKTQTLALKAKSLQLSCVSTSVFELCCLLFFASF